jgi:outer membrane protein TolC
VGSLAFPFLLALSPAACAGEIISQLSVQTDPPAATPQSAALDLAQCVQLALERQPSIAANRESLAAAATGSQALESLRVPRFLARDLPIRRQQASLGVSIAAAGVEQAEQETIYAVTRLYYTVIYAREQKKVADDVVAHMKATRDTAETALKAGSRDVTTSTVDKIDVYLGLAQTKQAEATMGIDRALAALREAIGLDPSYPLQIAGTSLPTPNVPVNRDDIIALALSRRPELVQVATFAEVTCLEIRAQGTKRKPRVITFAAASDIHARSVPQGVSDTEYRPGAIGPEMPGLMVGSRDLRMQRTRDLYARSQAVIEKTRNLIALEADDAYLRWKEASLKVAQTRQASGKGTKLAEDTRRDFGAEQKVKAEDVLTNEVLASQARAQSNEARHQLILALAALQRVTAGGFNAGLIPAPMAAAH